MGFIVLPISDENILKKCCSKMLSVENCPTSWRKLLNPKHSFFIHSSFAILQRHTQACFVWLLTHTRICQSTQRKSSSCTRAKSDTKCHHTYSRSQIKHTDQCSRNVRTNQFCARKYLKHLKKYSGGVPSYKSPWMFLFMNSQEVGLKDSFDCKRISRTVLPDLVPFHKI